jgi:release factor glutamine methyltransferase
MKYKTQVNVSDTVYDPQEDSYLLSQQVKKYAFGKVLDMGCGSGIQGIAALGSNKVESVTFSDINHNALRRAKEASGNAIEGVKNRDIIHSDLFSNISKKFDTIIFNPPYLPEDELDDEKAITTGGMKGNELIFRFLKDSMDYLEKDGIILLIFSTLSGKKEIDGYIKTLDCQKETIAQQGLFMERLYVYKIKKKSGSIRGHRGVVEISMRAGKRIAIKRPLNKNYKPEKEGEYLKILNRKKIGPIVYNYDANELAMEYIDGERILEHFKKAKKNDILSILKDIISQLSIMDELGINKHELTNPYKHIIIARRGPVQIDFERCTRSEKPKNITQFIQFLCSGRLHNAIAGKDVNINKDALMELAKIYKRAKNGKSRKLLISELLNNLH